MLKITIVSDIHSAASREADVFTFSEDSGELVPLPQFSDRLAPS